MSPFRFTRAGGKRTITNPDSTKYVGECWGGKPDGQGTQTYPDGTKYVGEFAEGVFHGQGILTNANGSKYVGEFANCMANGQGTATFPDGTKYVGEFVLGRFRGQGNLTKVVRESPDGAPCHRLAVLQYIFLTSSESSLTANHTTDWLPNL